MRHGIIVPDHVENHDAYIKGAEARIRFNAYKTAAKSWRIKHADAERLHDFLFQCGEFQDRQDITGGLFAGDFGELILSLRNQLLERGGLSDKQTEIVRNSLAKRVKWAAEREEKRRNEDAASDHVGTVGERRNFELTCIFVTSYEGKFGTTYVHGFKDDFGNVIIHKGFPILVDIEVDTRPRRLEKGDKVKLSATIKSHSERESVKQTLITRPSRAELGA